MYINTCVLLLLHSNKRHIKQIYCPDLGLHDRYLMCLWLYYILPPKHAPPAVYVLCRSQPSLRPSCLTDKAPFLLLTYWALPVMGKNFNSACDNFTGPEQHDPCNPKVRSQGLFSNICVAYYEKPTKVETCPPV